MSNIQSYNALIDRFKAFASGHFILKRFSHGQIEVSDLEKFGEYPFMHVVPSNVTYAKGMKTFSFQIVLADLPRDKEDKTEYQREVLSDLQRIAEDLVAEITNHRVLFGDLITVNNVSLEPFLEEFQHTLTGWTISLDLLVPYYWDACSIPAEWNDMFESSTGGTGSILTFTDSITRDDNGFVRLVNDEAEPSPNYYYGTNDEGVRGWYLLTDEVGLTCVTLPSCQTIIDIEAAIDLLQTDVTDLQSDVSSLDTNKVPYTGATGNVDLGEYELKAGQVEFDQTPTGTAGVAVMRWNDTDGTVDVGLKGGNVTLQVGQENVIRVVNKSGSNLLEANYQAVRVRLVAEGGAQGQRLAVVLALADNDADSATTIGLVTETINNNQEGFVTTSGEVKNINTTGSLQGETWVDGDILYLSGTTSGRITNVKPSAPTHTIIIGYVVYAHANNGKIFVKVDNGYELDELHNVSITSPTDNQALVYESASSLWKNETIDKTFVGLGNVDNTSDANKPISTATQTALNAKQDTLVSGTNIKTINGASVLGSGDLVVGGTTTLAVGTTPITSGTIGRVLFQGTGNVLQQSANLFWDNTNGRLGIGTATPSYIIHAKKDQNTSTELAIENITAGTLAASIFRFITSAGFGSIGMNSSTDTGLGSNRIYLYSGAGSSGIALRASQAAQNIRLYTGGDAAGNMRLSVESNGNVLIGTTTDAGFKLDVNGTARVVTSLAVSTGKTFSPYQSGGTANDALKLELTGTGAVLGIQNSNATGFSGVEYLSNTGSPRVFTGFNNSNGQEFRFNNFATGGYIGFLIGGTSALRIANSRSVLIGTETDLASSILTISSTTKGFLPPRMTNAQRLAIASPAVGLIVYCTDAVEGLYVNKSTGWTFVI